MDVLVPVTVGVGWLVVGGGSDGSDRGDSGRGGEGRGDGAADGGDGRDSWLLMTEVVSKVAG